MMGIYPCDYRNLKYKGGSIHTSLNIEHLSVFLSPLKPYNSPLTTAANNPEHASPPANIFLLLYPFFLLFFFITSSNRSLLHSHFSGAQTIDN